MKHGKIEPYAAMKAVSGWLDQTVAVKSAVSLLKVSGIGQDLFGGFLLNDETVLHKNNSFAQIDGFIQIVADKNDGFAGKYADFCPLMLLARNFALKLLK